MERLTVRSPADWSDCLACAGGRALARKAAIWMRGRGETAALLVDDELLAVAYLVPDGGGQWEFCLSIRPVARARMLPLCRLAQSTLRAFAETGGVVFCHVQEGNRSGARMARLTGFRHDAGTRWVLSSEGDEHGADREGVVRGR